MRVTATGRFDSKKSVKLILTERTNADMKRRGEEGRGRDNFSLRRRSNGRWPQATRARTGVGNERRASRATMVDNGEYAVPTADTRGENLRTAAGESTRVCGEPQRLFIRHAFLPEELCLRSHHRQI